MKYTHVRYAYYDIFTEYQYKPAILKNQRGLLDLLTEVRVKAQHFLDVARYMAGKIAANPVAVNGRVLTVFMAPEFYLRASVGDRDGSSHYSRNEVDQARAAIKDSVRFDSRFEDWLLIPGTAVYSEWTGYGYLIFNDLYAIARLSGPMGGGVVDWHCIKQDFSEFDQLEERLNAAHYLDGDQGVGVAYQQIAHVGGVDIGIEICLDHANRALKQAVLAARPPRNVDLQLVCACGTDVAQAGVATRAKGYVLRCNGNDVDRPSANEYRIGPWPGNQITSKGAPSIVEMLDSTAVHRFDLPDGLQIRSAPSFQAIRLRDTVGYFDSVPL